MDDKSDTASAAAASAPLAKPKRSWGDVVEDEIPEDPSASTTSAEHNADGLAIEENKKINTFLDEAEDSNINAATIGGMLCKLVRRFVDLNLSGTLLKGLHLDMQFEKPNKIQAIGLPMVLTPPYKNLIVQAYNGSGKTTCSLVGMLSRVDPNLKAPQALGICPTRELAIQNLEVLRRMGKYTGITSECVPMDSMNYMPIAKRPPVTAQIVISTPDTIKKWISAKKLDVSCVKILVFDEADHMLSEDGFKDDSLSIMKGLNKAVQCQVLLFSATFNETVSDFVARAVKDCNQLFVKKEELTLQSVKQYKVYCPDDIAKLVVIKDRIFKLGENLGQTIIFIPKIHCALMLRRLLGYMGYDVPIIQGVQKQKRRDKIVKEFKDGLTQVLISTDLLVQGFDGQKVHLVINYDLPVKRENCSEPDYEVYLHRIGLVGRFGSQGAVFNLLLDDVDNMLMKKIERHFGTQISEVPSWNSDDDFKGALKTASLL